MIAMSNLQPLYHIVPHNMHPCLLAVVVVAAVVTSFEIRGDGTACYKGCSGHGECRQYMCHCDTGFHGEDCSIAYVDDGAPALPVLSAGHFNATKKSHRQWIKRTQSLTMGGAPPLVLFGYSSVTCARCVVFEREYELLTRGLTSRGVRCRGTPIHSHARVSL